MPHERWQHVIDTCHAILDDVALSAYHRAFYWLRVANAHCWRNEFHHATYAARMAIALYPLHAEAHVALARILLTNGKTPQGIRHFATAAEIDVAWFGDATRAAKQHGYKLVLIYTPRIGYAVRAA